MGVVGVLLPCFLESKMSLYAVSQLTSVESVHCQPHPWKYNDLPVPDTRVATRVGRRFKSLDSAIRLAQRVGGWVQDLNGGRIVFDANEKTGA